MCDECGCRYNGEKRRVAIAIERENHHHRNPFKLKLIPKRSPGITEDFSGLNKPGFGTRATETTQFGAKPFLGFQELGRPFKGV